MDLLLLLLLDICMKGYSHYRILFFHHFKVLHQSSSHIHQSAEQIWKQHANRQTNTHTHTVIIHSMIETTHLSFINPSPSSLTQYLWPRLWASCITCPWCWQAIPPSSVMEEALVDSWIPKQTHDVLVCSAAGPGLHSHWSRLWFGCRNLQKKCSFYWQACQTGRGSLDLNEKHLKKASLPVEPDNNPNCYNSEQNYTGNCEGLKELWRKVGHFYLLSQHGHNDFMVPTTFLNLWAF